MSDIRNLPAWFKSVRIERADGSRAVLDDCLDDWQRADFAAQFRAWQFAAGLLPPDDTAPITSRFYLERPRGHSKTSDGVILPCWLIEAAPSRKKIIVAGADKDQGLIDLDAAARYIRANGREAVLEIQASKILNKITGSLIEVVSSDSYSAFGHLVDAIVLDELTNWPDRGEALYRALVSALPKRPHCILLTLTNAPIVDSWQWAVRENARQDAKRWYFHSLPGPVASWISKADIEEQERLLPTPFFQRYWLNQPTSGAGDALRQEDITAAVTESGPSQRQPNEIVVGFLDIGLTHDSSCLVFIAKTGTQYRLLKGFEWRPPKGGKVQLDDIESTILDCHQQYRFRRLGVDPWQGAQLVQRCQARGVPIEECVQSGGVLVQQAVALLEAFNTRSIALYDWAPLISDLRRLRVEERSYGFRLVSSRGVEGHGDRATALSGALALARKLGVSRPFEVTVGAGVDPREAAQERRWGHAPLSAFARGEERGDNVLRNGESISGLIARARSNQVVRGGERPEYVDTSRPENQKNNSPGKSTPGWSM